MNIIIVRFKIPRVQLIINNNNIVQVSYFMTFDIKTSFGLFTRRKKYQTSCEHFETMQNPREMITVQCCYKFLQANCMPINVV